jgi:hypothetical protein
VPTMPRMTLTISKSSSSGTNPAINALLIDH